MAPHQAVTRTSAKKDAGLLRSCSSPKRPRQVPAGGRSSSSARIGAMRERRGLTTADRSALRIAHLRGLLHSGFTITTYPRRERSSASARLCHAEGRMFTIRARTGARGRHDGVVRTKEPTRVGAALPAGWPSLPPGRAPTADRMRPGYLVAQRGYRRIRRTSAGETNARADVMHTFWGRLVIFGVAVMGPLAVREAGRWLERRKIERRRRDPS